MSYALNLTLSEFSAGLWAKREQNTPDLEALGRSLEAIEPFASPEICCCKPDEANQMLATIKAVKKRRFKSFP
jgi:hypothetical protein